MHMNDLIPGLSEFLTSLDDKPKVQAPDGFENEREAWQLGDFIPSTYLQDGVRKIYVWGMDEPVRYTYSPVEGLKQVKEIF